MIKKVQYYQLRRSSQERMLIVWVLFMTYKRTARTIRWSMVFVWKITQTTARWNPVSILCVYEGKNGIILYLTGTDMTDYFWLILRLVLPNISNEDWSSFQHSLSVYLHVSSFMRLEKIGLSSNKDLDGLVIALKSSYETQTQLMLSMFLLWMTFTLAWLI